MTDIKFADNSTPIPEPILSNVVAWAEKKYLLDEFDRKMAINCAQYGYNISQVYVKEQQTTINELRGRIKELEAEIKELKIMGKGNDTNQY